MASDENFILQQSVWKVKLYLGYIIDEVFCIHLSKVNTKLS